MAETTGIAWTDSTFNPWIGCTKVGPGCDHCYAEALDKRHRWGGATHWGVGVERKRTSEDYWKKPLAWNRAREKDGKTHRVFCASLADVFDNEVPDAWRHDLFDLIEQTPRLTWLLLTKRIVRVKHHTRCLLPNVWIGATIVNQEEADRDLPRLVELPARVRFISYEPAVGPVAWGGLRGVDWLIIGGESTQGAPARPFPVYWARDTIKQCRREGVAPFVKQLGSFVIDRDDAGFEGDGDDLWPVGTANKVEHDPFGYVEGYQGAPVRVRLKDRAGADLAEWPSDLRVQEFPASVASGDREGKPAA